MTDNNCRRLTEAEIRDALLVQLQDARADLTAARQRIAELEALRKPAAEMLEWADSWLPDEANDQGARGVRNELRRVLKEVGR